MGWARRSRSAHAARRCHLGPSLVGKDVHGPVAQTDSGSRPPMMLGSGLLFDARHCTHVRGNLAHGSGAARRVVDGVVPSRAGLGPPSPGPAEPPSMDAMGLDRPSTLGSGAWRPTTHPCVMVGGKPLGRTGLVDVPRWHDHRLQFICSFSLSRPAVVFDMEPADGIEMDGFCALESTRWRYTCG